MVNYQDDARVNLKNTQSKKLKYTAKNKAQTTLILNKKTLKMTSSTWIISNNKIDD